MASTAVITWDFFRTYYGANDLPSDDKMQARFNTVNPLVGLQFEKYLGRPLFQASREQRFDTLQRRSAYFLRGMPVASVESIEYDAAGLFDGGEITLDTDEYVVDSQTGRIEIFRELDDSRGGLKVMATTGLVANVAALVDPTNDYHGVAVAAAIQIKNLLERRDSLGNSSESRGRGSATFVQSNPFVPEVTQMLEPLRLAGIG